MKLRMHDLTWHNEYPHKFVDSLKNPSRCSPPSSNTIYQGTGNCFNTRIIFKTKHTTWDKDKNWTGYRCPEDKAVHIKYPLRLRQCYISKTRSPLVACTKLNSMVWVRERTIPTERPLLVGKVIANLCGQKVPRAQRDGSLRPYFSVF
jgi:hypothetical protein